MHIWMATMECAGIAEAGGVKNVARSLSESLAQNGNDVTLFIPLFGCTCFDEMNGLDEHAYPPVSMSICGKDETVSFEASSLAHTGIRVIFICSSHFSEKLGVYTYTAEEERKNPANKKGQGHADALLLETLFQRAVSLFGRYVPPQEAPDIILCEDAPTASLPSYIAYSGLDVFSKTKCVVTIHNAGPAYHHEFSSIESAEAYTCLPKSVLCGAMSGNRIEPFLLAAGCAALSTVSTQYAKELTDPANTKDTDGLSEIFFRRSIHITGITNGIDYDRYNPTRIESSLLPFAFNPEKGDFDGKYRCRDFFLTRFASEKQAELHAESVRYLGGLERFGYLVPCDDGRPAVYFGYHGRIVSQKGIQVLAATAGRITEEYTNARLVIIGQGEASLEHEIEQLACSSRGRIVFFKGYNRAMARLASASSDFIVLPSYFEPCGLEDFIAQIYGTLPVANATGGLNKIIDGETGFLYTPNTPEKLTGIVSRLIGQKTADPSCFDAMAAYAASFVHANYSWQEVVQNQYMPFFTSLVKGIDKKQRFI